MAVTEDFVFAQLWAAAESEADARGVGWSSESATEVQGLLRNGARAMVERGDLAEPRMQEAQANVHVFVAEMASAAVELAPAEDAPVLAERTVERAFRRLCPIFPIC